jgi:hypothetical protein
MRHPIQTFDSEKLGLIKVGKRGRELPDGWIEAKDEVLVAIVMRYLFDQILNQPFSVLLSCEERDLIASIETAMSRTHPEKGMTMHPEYLS